MGDLQPSSLRSQNWSEEIPLRRPRRTPWKSLASRLLFGVCATVFLARTVLPAQGTLQIYAVKSDLTGLSDPTLDISGLNFGHAQGQVTFDGCPVGIVFWTPTEILVTISSNLPPGSYQLVVKAARPGTASDNFEVALGRNRTRDAKGATVATDPGGAQDRCGRRRP